MIISKTPFRVSFFGGGTDYPAWYRENGGKVLACGINKYCYLSVRNLPPFFEHKYRVVYSIIENTTSIDDIKHPAVRNILAYMKCQCGLEIHHDADLPARSGLGSSSAFTVGLLNSLYALSGEYTSRSKLAKEAINIEQNVIKEAVGSQDQVSAAYGGFNKIEFLQNDEFIVSPVIIDPVKMQELSKNLMLFYTGISRFSTDISSSKIANIPKRSSELKNLGQMVDHGLDILSSNNVPLSEFGALLHEAWQNKRKISSKVSNNVIDDIYEEARKNGALGGKILGAGGGGFILFYVPYEYQERVRNALEQLIYVPFGIDNGGSRIVVYQPDEHITHC